MKSLIVLALTFLNITAAVAMDRCTCAAYDKDDRIYFVGSVSEFTVCVHAYKKCQRNSPNPDSCEVDESGATCNYR